MDILLKGFYLAGLAASVFMRFPAGMRYRQERIADRRQRVIERLLLPLSFLGLPLLPLVYLLTPWLSFADYQLPYWAGLVGIPVFGAGVWLLWRSQVDLGRNWSKTMEIREGHSLITKGVYRNIRHPMYAAHWLWGIGQPLLLQNWIAGLSMLVIFIPLYLTRAAREEQMMLDHFGEEYRSYIKKTGRIIPKLINNQPNHSSRNS